MDPERADDGDNCDGRIQTGSSKATSVEAGGAGAPSFQTAPARWRSFTKLDPADPRTGARSRSPRPVDSAGLTGVVGSTRASGATGHETCPRRQAWHWSSDADSLTQAATFQAIRRRAHPLWHPDLRDPPPLELHAEAIRGEVKEEVMRFGFGPAVRSITHHGTGTTILLWRASIAAGYGQTVFQRLLPTDAYRTVGRAVQGQKRHTCWLSEPPCRCPYRYTGVAVPATPMPPYLTRLAYLLQADLPSGSGQSVFNCVNITKYDARTSTLPWHADNESLFGKGREDVCILSWSLGASMDFEVRARHQVAPWLRTTLRHGDAMLMMGQMQQHHQHQARPTREALTQETQRINLTWRRIRHHECAWGT